MKTTIISAAIASVFLLNACSKLEEQQATPSVVSDAQTETAELESLGLS